MRPTLSRSQSCVVYGRTSMTAGLPGSTPACASCAALRSTCKPLLSVATVSLRFAREASTTAFRLPAGRRASSMWEVAFRLTDRVRLGRGHELERVEDVHARLVARAALAEDAGDLGDRRDDPAVLVLLVENRWLSSGRHSATIRKRTQPRSP